MRTFILPLLLFSTLTSIAQPDKEAILKPINDLFAGMRAGDMAKIKRVFAMDPMFDIVISNKDEKPYIKVKLKDFIENVGSPRKEKLNELIWNEVIQHDRGFAQVWANYAFYRGKAFSHCGIDAFQLVRVGEDWKIINLSYTVRKDSCNIPKEISDKFK